MEMPEFFQGSAYCSQFPAAGDHFIVEELLDIPNEVEAIGYDGGFDPAAAHSSHSSTANLVDSCNSSSLSVSDPNATGDIACQNLSDVPFAGDLCVPYDELVELEWLSNFVEESFSSEDPQKLQSISGVHGRTHKSSETRGFQPGFKQDHAILSNHNNPILDRQVSVPAKTRSKRSRAAAAHWATGILAISPTTFSEPEISIVPTPQPPAAAAKKTAKTASTKRESGDGNGEGRKCLHCATDKTPQWRTGPMGPKTLCNACGVRYKSGRLVPEYRPAASPTFVLTKHSNSHRKVLELRRQKELVRAQQQQQQQFLQHHHHHQNLMFDLSNGEDFLIHQHLGPDFGHLI